MSRTDVRSDRVGVPLEQLIPDRFRARHRAAVKAFGDAGSGQRPMTHRPEVTALRIDGDEFPIDATTPSGYAARR